MKRTILFISMILIFASAYSQSIVGTWKTIDDESGKARSIVEIYEKEGRFFGKIQKLFREEGEDPDPICDECEDHRKGKKIIGMEIISDMKFNKKDDEYHKGEIMDPENGNIYDCKLWVGEDGNLKVRGYLLFFYRTQTWLPYSGE
ncbi:DUF2147 domain-containing protein [Ekhidna sp. To15]|uniref:DUF2147 domain-containing protein n=1 Tax=Ekhidna sp. To15 TaxID=3395267 RepID=UPI003F522BF5